MLTWLLLMALVITDGDFKQEVEEGKLPGLVDFWAEWCGPCRLAEPVIEELAVKYQGKVKIGKLDVDENNQQALRFGVMSIPTVILFKDGKEVERQVGYVGKAGYERLAEKALGD